MTTERYFMIRSIVGVVYALINIFVRKIPQKNPHTDGWLISTLWVALPELCLVFMMASYISHAKNKYF